jgi:hypothetical protein
VSVFVHFEIDDDETIARDQALGGQTAVTKLAAVGMAS